MIYHCLDLAYKTAVSGSYDKLCGTWAAADANYDRDLWTNPGRIWCHAWCTGRTALSLLLAQWP